MTDVRSEKPVIEDAPRVPMQGLIRTLSRIPDYARLVFEAAGLTPELRPTNEREYRTSARRPKFSALANARMAAIGVEPMPPLEWCIRDYFARREKYQKQSA